jgi:two-component sensor histidine kinase
MANDELSYNQSKKNRAFSRKGRTLMNENKEPAGLTAFREHILTAEAYLLCTPSGRVRYASGPLKLMIEEDLSGRNLNDFLEDATAARLIAETLAGNPYAFRCEMHGQAFNCRAEPWEDGDGIQIALFPVNSDKDRIKPAGMGLFMARELDRELGVLMPAAQLLRDSASPQQAPAAAVLQLHLYRLLRMSRNVEELALVESGKLQLYYSEVDLRDFCRNLLEQVRPYCEAWNIELHYRLPDVPVQCRVDADRVRSVMLHLLSNAILAQKDGGAVSVTLQQRENGDAVLSVADRGCGMGGDLFRDVNRAVGQEDSRSTGGLGLGLELTRAYVDAHGGQMMLMSGEGGGLVARITLPRGEQAVLTELNAWRAPYGTGIDPLLVELSCAAKKEMLMRR